MNIFDKLLAKIPAKRHKGLKSVLLNVAVLLALFGGLLIMGFLEKEKQTGMLWWKETIYYSQSERMPYLVISICLFVIAIFCIIVALYFAILPGRYNKYMQIIGDCRKISIQQIADITKSPKQNVEKDLQNMIDSGMIDGYYIDYKMSVLLAKGNKKKTFDKIRRCKSCGAVNSEDTLRVGECEYCGLPIE